MDEVELSVYLSSQSLDEIHLTASYCVVLYSAGCYCLFPDVVRERIVVVSVIDFFFEFRPLMLSKLKKLNNQRFLYLPRR